MTSQTISVVFVCMGNICRSPTAEGVFRHVVNTNQLQHKIKIDSAGTHAYHIGEQPDARAQATARSRGVNLSSQRARKIDSEDFVQFDYVIAMDRSNYENLESLKNSSNDTDQKASLHLFLEFAREWSNEEVPDPYYGGDKGFEEVFDMVESASNGLLQHIMKRHSIS